MDLDGVPPNSLEVPPRIVIIRGALKTFFQGSPPLLRSMHLGEALVGLVARVGAHRDRRWVIPRSPPLMGNSRGTPKRR